MKFQFGLALLCSILFAGSANATEVVRVIDGDTVVFRENGKDCKCRLAGIDAPEKAQPFGPESTQHLKDLVKDGITLQNRRRDFYGRTLAVVSGADGRDIGFLMIVDGYAWAYKRKTGFYAESQAIAKAGGYGLWVDPNPVAPWVFRKSKRKPLNFFIRQPQKVIFQGIAPDFQVA